MTESMARPPQRRSGTGAKFASSMVAAVFLLAASGEGLGTRSEDPGQRPSRPPHRLVFADDFRGGRLDAQKWNTCYWWDRGGCTNASTKEKQWYLPHNVKVRNGALHLVARRQTVRGSDGKTHRYTSGIVTTGRAREDHHLRPRFAFTYGRVAVRMKAPAGRGLWSAIWLLPLSQESRPEIDVVEVLGHRPRWLHAHFHYLSDGRERDPGHNWKGAHVSRRWHVYAVDWSPRRLVWFVDGREVWRFTRNEFVPQEPMYLLINLAVGGEWPGNPSGSTKFPSSIDVDYVRVWQRSH